MALYYESSHKLRCSEQESITAWTDVKWCWLWRVGPCLSERNLHTLRTGHTKTIIYHLASSPTSKVLETQWPTLALWSFLASCTPLPCDCSVICRSEFYENFSTGTEEMAQLVKTLLRKHGNLELIPRTYIKNPAGLEGYSNCHIWYPHSAGRSQICRHPNSIMGVRVTYSEGGMMRKGNRNWQLRVTRPQR